MARSVATHIITTNRVKNSSADAEVLLGHHDHDGERPGERDRQQVPRLGNAQRADAPGAGGDQLAVVGQVAGEEQRERDLGELARLEVDRPDAHPDLGAADAAADARHQRQHQQPGADEEERPLVAREVGRRVARPAG